MMGGFGSGRPSGSGRKKVEACRSIDVNWLNREGCLKSGFLHSLQWTCGGGTAVCVGTQDQLLLAWRVPIGGGEWEEVYETVRIVHIACRYGGTRPYFVCPGSACGRRVAKLYGPGRYFLCRHCYRLAHGQAFDAELRADEIFTLQAEWLQARIDKRSFWK